MRLYSAAATAAGLDSLLGDRKWSRKRGGASGLGADGRCSLIMTD